jgi:hypothetical protein
MSIWYQNKYHLSQDPDSHEQADQHSLPPTSEGWKNVPTKGRETVTVEPAGATTFVDCEKWAAITLTSGRFTLIPA